MAGAVPLAALLVRTEGAEKDKASRVEEGRGIAKATRFPPPLIKPDVRVSRIRLSDWLHVRLTTGRLPVCNDAAWAHQVTQTPHLW